jgi:hypothetical protein
MNVAALLWTVFGICVTISGLIHVQIGVVGLGVVLILFAFAIDGLISNVPR